MRGPGGEGAGEAVAEVEGDEVAAFAELLEGLAGELVCANASEADIAEIRALHYQMVAHHARGELAEYFRFNQRIHLRIVESAGNAEIGRAHV